MEYSRIQKVTFDFLEYAKMSDEHIVRDMAMQLIKDLPFDVIEKMFKVKKTDPRSGESLKVLKNPNSTYSEKEHLRMLHCDRIVEYLITINI